MSNVIYIPELISIRREDADMQGQFERIYTSREKAMDFIRELVSQHLPLGNDFDIARKKFDWFVSMRIWSESEGRFMPVENRFYASIIDGKYEDCKNNPKYYDIYE